MVETIAQIIGIVGLFINIIIFQQKKQGKILVLQFFATIAWFSNFLLLGATTGAILNAVGAIRALVFYFEKQTNAKSALWLAVFAVAYMVPFVLTFTIFNKPLNVGNFIIELLPVVAMMLETVGLKLGTPKSYRFLRGISSPMWLIYNCFTGSIGAILAESLSLVSIGVGIARFDIKKTAIVENSEITTNNDTQNLENKEVASTEE